MTDTTTDSERTTRRRFVRSAAAAGLLAAAPAGPFAGFAGADSVGPDEYTFYDDWEDGNFTEDPGWELWREEGDFAPSVVERSVPGDGEHALRISETHDFGRAGTIGWAESYDGWDSRWRLEGMSYTDDVPLDSDFQGHRVRLYVGPDVETAPLNFALGFLDSDGEQRPVKINGELIDEVQETRSVDWREDVWYRYEIEHGGDGTYTARFWRDNEDRPSSPQARSVGSAPGTEARSAAINVNGANYRDLTLDHAFMGWQTEFADQSGGGESGDNESEDNHSHDGETHDSESDDNPLPGPGIAGALASLGGAGYLLDRRTSESIEE